MTGRREVYCEPIQRGRKERDDGSRWESLVTVSKVGYVCFERNGENKAVLDDEIGGLDITEGCTR